MRWMIEKCEMQGGVLVPEMSQEVRNFSLLLNHTNELRSIQALCTEQYLNLPIRKE